MSHQLTTYIPPLCYTNAITAAINYSNVSSYCNYTEYGKKKISTQGIPISAHPVLAHAEGLPRQQHDLSLFIFVRIARRYHGQEHEVLQRSSRHFQAEKRSASYHHVSSSAKRNTWRFLSVTFDPRAPTRLRERSVFTFCPEAPLMIFAASESSV